MIINLHPISYQCNCPKPTKKFEILRLPLQSDNNLAPLKADTLSFTGNPKDLLKLTPHKIIEVCEKSLKDGIRLGEGKEAIAYKIEDYPEYCIRQEKIYTKPKQGFKLNRTLNKYDLVNHVVAKLDEGTTIMKYVSGMPIKIISSIDTKRPIKETIQGLLANEFPERAFIKVLKQIEDAKFKDIDFDRFGENLHVDPLNQEMVCIDFSPYIKDPTGEYNPISYIYTALDVDGTQHAERVLGKLCSAYAQRLIDTPINRLNFDKLDTNFYHRGFESDAFNHFEDRELLHETQKHIEELVKLKKEHTPKSVLQNKVSEFKEFIDKNLMPIKDYSYYASMIVY